eukprot:gnl/MRDRNA2_/MRDRNA2_141100_c0_seq1.p1 gnl/MRDRNA2_/MRDRNA2_141100_c0~~gnl/MRDRNA2_/MRDRNA2_141100_c0_seq1.p1  ORF type:complete len:467 (-),score=89.14 gnl/MRDRNA2_/MRDRNA2_141100_c0_seq1:339-1739(-)
MTTRHPRECSFCRWRVLPTFFVAQVLVGHVTYVLCKEAEDTRLRNLKLDFKALELIHKKEDLVKELGTRPDVVASLQATPDLAAKVAAATSIGGESLMAAHEALGRELWFQAGVLQIIAERKWSKGSSNPAREFWRLGRKISTEALRHVFQRSHAEAALSIQQAFVTPAYLAYCRERAQLGHKAVGNAGQDAPTAATWPKELTQAWSCVQDLVELILLCNQWEPAKVGLRLNELNGIGFTKYGEHPSGVHLQLPFLKAQPWWSIEEVPFLFGLQEEYEALHAEFAAALDRSKGALWEKDPGHHGDYLVLNGSWPTVSLHNGEKFLEAGCTNLPLFCTTLKKHLGARLQKQRPAGFPEGFPVPKLGASVYSLPPGSELRAHFGQPGRLGAHLPLVVPAGREGESCCTLEVAGEARSPRNGAVMVFDDAFAHRASNHWGSSTRYVLGLFFWHPDTWTQAENSNSDLEL